MHHHQHAGNSQVVREKVTERTIATEQVPLHSSHTLITPIVEQHNLAPVVKELVRSKEIDEIQPVVHREIQKTEVHEVIQPIMEREVLATAVHTRTATAEIRPEVIQGGPYQHVQTEHSDSRREALRTEVIMKPAIIEETIRPRIIEEVQPVIHREILENHLVKEERPIYEKVVEAPVVMHETRQAMMTEAKIAPAYVDNSPLRTSTSTSTSAVVEGRTLNPIIKEVVKSREIDEIQPVVHREIQKTEVHEVVQPIMEREVLATAVHTRTAAAEIRPEVIQGAPYQHVQLEHSNSRRETLQTEMVMKPAIIEETIRPRIIEEIQPVIHREILENHLVKEERPIYEKVVEAPVVMHETRQAMVTEAKIAPAYVDNSPLRTSTTSVQSSQVEQVTLQPVVKEVVRSREIDEIQPVVHREIQKTEVHEVVQPIMEREVLATAVHTRVAAAEIRPEIVQGGPYVHVSHDHSESHRETLQTEVVMKAAIIEETIRPHIIEEVQPIIHREIIESHLVKEERPIFEKIVEAPVVTHEVRAPIVHQTILPVGDILEERIIFEQREQSGMMFEQREQSGMMFEQRGMHSQGEMMHSQGEMMHSHGHEHNRGEMMHSHGHEHGHEHHHGEMMQGQRDIIVERDVIPLVESTRISEGYGHAHMQGPAVVETTTVSTTTSAGALHNSHGAPMSSSAPLNSSHGAAEKKHHGLFHRHDKDTPAAGEAEKKHGLFHRH